MARIDEFELDRFVEMVRTVGTDFEEVEVKSAVGGLPKSLAETLCAFSNTSGGIVVCGLSEKDGFKPVGGFDASAVQDALASMCAEKIEPPVRPHIELVEYEGHVLVVATVPEMPPHSKPCYIKARSLYDGAFVRVGDGDRRLSRYEVDRMLEMRRQPRCDARAVEEAVPEDLDKELVRGFLARQRALSPRLFGTLSDEDALLSTHVLVRGDNGAIHPSLAGLVALGTHPQQFFPRLNVTFAAFPGTSKAFLGEGNVRFLDSRSLRGPIPVLVAETLALVRKNTRTTSYMKGASRVDVPEYPEVAVREALANALMHRDYSDEGCSTSVQVNLFTDRLEIINPGGLYGGVTIERLGEYGVSSTRNQFLSDILEATPYPVGYAETGCVVENKGTGYAQIRLALESAGMQPPVARDSIASFSLTMYSAAAAEGGCSAQPRVPFDISRMTSPKTSNSTISAAKQQAQDQPTSGSFTTTLDNGEQWIIDWVVEHGSVQTPDVAEGLGVSRATALRRLNELCDRGILERKGKPRSPMLRYQLAG